MLSKNDAEFVRDPVIFLKTNAVIVSEYEQMDIKRISHVRCFTFAPFKNNIVLLKFHQAGRDIGEGITAYWLPWLSHNATTLKLGDDARFFFTSQLTNCRFSVIDRNPFQPIVAHVAGDLNSSMQRNKAEQANNFGVGDDASFVRRLSVSDSRDRRPFGMKQVIPKKHCYTGQTGLPENYSSAFVFGYVDFTGSWKFNAQIVKGALVEGFYNHNSHQHLQIIDCRNI